MRRWSLVLVLGGLGAGGAAGNGAHGMEVASKVAGKQRLLPAILGTYPSALPALSARGSASGRAREVLASAALSRRRRGAATATRGKRLRSGPAEFQMPFERALELTEEAAGDPTDPSRDWAKDPLGLGALLPGPLRTAERTTVPVVEMFGDRFGKRRRPAVPTQQEQVVLVKSVQRLKALEEIYAELADTDDAADAADAEGFFPAAAAGGGQRSASWAAAAGVSEEELRAQLWQGMNAREQILVRNLGLVYLQVGTVKQKDQFRFGRAPKGSVDPGTTEDDLVQEGALALLRAAEQYDPSRGVRFSTYASTAILRRMENALMSQTRIVRVPTWVYVQYNKIRRATGQLSRFLPADVYPTDEEICEQLALDGLKLTPAKVRDVIAKVERPELSLATPVTRPTTSVKVLLDILPDDDAGLELDVLMGLLRDDLERLLATALEPMEAAVLRRRFGLDAGEGPQTIRQVREGLGLVENQEVTTLTRRGLRKLKKHLQKLGIDSAYMDEYWV